MGIKEELKQRYENKGDTTNSIPSSNSGVSVKDELKQRYEQSNPQVRETKQYQNVDMTPVKSRNNVNNLSPRKITNRNISNVTTKSKQGVNYDQDALRDIRNGVYNKYVSLGSKSQAYESKQNLAFPTVDRDGNNVSLKSMDDKMDFMSENEKNYYLYMLGKNQNEKAEEYLKSLRGNLEDRERTYDNYRYYQYGKEHPVLATIDSFMDTPLKIIQGADMLYHTKIKGEEIDPNAPYFSATNRQQIMRNAASEGMSSFGKTAYNIFNSSVESLSAMALPGIAAPAVALGASAASDTSYDSALRGGSTNQVLANGLAAGIAEALFERISIGNFKSLKNVPVKSVKDVITNTIKTSLVNGSEEMATELSNKITDKLIMQDLSQYDLLWKECVENGMSESQAKSQTILELAKDIADAGITGAIQGGIMGMGGMAVNAARTSKTGKNTSDQNYSEYVEGIDPNVSEEGYEAYKYAMKLAKQQENNQKVTNYQKGMMEYLTDSAINAAPSEGTYIEKENVEQKDKDDNAYDDTDTHDQVDISEPIDTKNALYNDSDITIKKIEKVENGQVYADVINKDGKHETVNVSDISFKNENTDTLYYNASKFGTSGANAYVSNYEGQTSLKVYDDAFKAYYDAGLTHRSLDTIKSEYPVQDNISDVMQYAYNSGYTDSYVNIDSNNLRQSKNGYTGIIKNKASQHMNGVEKGVINLYAKELGISVEMTDHEGSYNGYNDNGKIVISNKASNPSLVVFTHEITHEFETRAPQEYANYRDYVINAMQDIDGKLFAERKSSIENIYKSNGVKLTEEEVLNEMAANATEEFLLNPERITDIIKSDRTTAQKFIDIVKNITNRLKKLYAKYSPKSAEARMIKQNIEVFENARTLWETAFESSKYENINESLLNSNSDMSNDTKYSIIEIDKNNDAEIDLDDLEKYNYIGIRSLSSDESYNIGDKVRNSYDWDYENDRSSYGTENESELNGSCAINTKIDTYWDTKEEMIEKISDAINNYSYNGDKVILASKMAETGADDGEIIMQDSIVVGKVINNSHDIKYSLNERAILADAFTNVAQSEDEKATIKEYKENVSKINDKVRKLSMIRSEIKELSFAPGKRDTAKISSLKEQAKKLENSIQWYDKKLISLEASKPLQDVIKREKSRVKTSNKEYFKNQLKAQRDYYNERLDQQKDKYKAQTEKSREYRKCRELQSKITKNVKEMGTWLTNATDKKHVPENLRVLTANFLDSIDFSSDRLNKYGEPTARTNLWNKLSKQYQKIINAAESDQGTYIELDPDFQERLDSFIDSTEKKKLVEMNSTELEELHQLVASMKKAIVDANKLHLSKSNKTASDVANGFVLDCTNKKPHKDMLGFRQITDDLLNVQMLDSFSFFDRLGPTMKQFYHDSIRAGFDKKIKNTKIASDYIVEVLQGIDVYKEGWTGKKAKTSQFTINGETIEFTPAQIMSLYVQNKREQARGHIYGGGIKQAPVTVYRDSKLGPFTFKKSTIVKSYNPVSVSEADVNNIIDTLTAKQKEVADKIVKFFVTQTSEWGNEVSMEMYGYNKFTEKNYFPIVSDSNYLATKDGDTTNPISTLKNMGSTKNIVKGANNPIIIEDIFDVYTRQADQMGSYNAFVIPLSDLQKVFNTKGTKEHTSVKQVMEKYFGNGAKSYITNLMIDINGSARQGIGTDLPSKTISNMKIASVGANLRVAIQQPTAIVRASTEINPKYLAKAMTTKGDFEKAKEYAPIAQWKDWGFFEMDTGRQMKDIMLGTHGLQALKEKSMFLASKGDSVTWGKIWKAVEFETEDNTNLEKGSKEFYEYCGQRFSDIIDKTQVVDSVLHRSQIMRSKDLLVKTATSFMSEPTKSYNLIVSAANRMISENTKENKNYFARCVSTFVITSFVTAAASSIIDALRDKDKEKPFIEKYVDKITSSFFDNTNPLNMIPFAKEVSSITQGYDPTRTEMAGIVDVIKASKNLCKYLNGESKKTALECAEDMVTSFSKLTGLPIKNAVRDTKAIVNTIVGTSFDDNDPVSYDGVKSKYNINDWDKSSEKYYDAMYEAYKRNDNQEYNRIVKDIYNAGHKMSDIDKALHNRIQKELLNNDSIKEIAKAKINRDNNKYYEKVIELAKQHYTVKDINAAVDKYINKLLDGAGA